MQAARSLLLPPPLLPLPCMRSAHHGKLMYEVARIPPKPCHPCPASPPAPQAPLTVLLYVSAARRVQGFVAAEPIKEAYCARPSLPPAAAQGMLSCGSAVQPASGSGAAHAADAAATVAPFEGHPTAAAAAAQAHVATSGRSLLSVTLSTGAAAAECSSSAAAEGAGGGAPAAAAPAAAEAGDGEVAAAAGCTPGLPTSLQQQQQAQPEAQQAQQQLQQTQQPPVLPPLELDRSRRVRAVCGVRLMWVSLEARRRGLASRLLDCCRSHFMPGYVLSRHELAFRWAARMGAWGGR